MAQTPGFTGDRAQSYDDRVRRLIPGYEILHALAETILSTEIPDDAKLLIAGIGTGIEILEWAPRHSRWNFLGQDPSQEMIDIAGKKIAGAGLGNRARLETTAMESIAETDFDAATLLLVLHFVADDGAKAEILSAIAERLKPGAPFLMATIFGEAASTRHKRLIAWSKAWAIAHGVDTAKAEELCDPARTDLHVVPEERLKHLLRNAGFIDVQRIYQAFSIGLWLARAAID